MKAVRSKRIDQVVNVIYAMSVKRFDNISDGAIC